VKEMMRWKRTYEGNEEGEEEKNNQSFFSFSQRFGRPLSNRTHTESQGTGAHAQGRNFEFVSGEITTTLKQRNRLEQTFPHPIHKEKKSIRRNNRRS
jgi:hypothetical protein